MDTNIIINEISKKYNLSFLDKLKDIEGISVYAFGGCIRDIMLNREWKEVDIRITLDNPERESIIEKALLDYNLEGKTQIADLELTVYRFPPLGSTGEPIDLSLVPSLLYNTPDFTINGMFLNLVTKDLITNQGDKDINNKLIQTVGDPMIRFKNEPHMMFRAIKFACQLNFNLSQEVQDAIVFNNSLIKETLAFISEKKEGIFVELFLGNIFKGLKSKPNKYFELIRDLKIFDQFVMYFSNRFDKEVNQIIYPEQQSDVFEENIYYLFSCITNSLVDCTPEDTLMFLNELCINTPKEYSDFNIDISKLK